MRISTRLSLIIALATSSILILFGIIIYFFVSFHQERDFQNQLKKRLIITENFFLEKSSFSKEEYKKIKTQFLQTLPQETEEIVEIQNNKHPVFKHSYPKNLIAGLINNSTLSFKQGNRQGESKHFLINGKTYLVIVSAVDEIVWKFLPF